MGQYAAETGSKGEFDGASAIVRLNDEPYEAGCGRVELSDVAAKTKHMPDEFIKGSNDVTEEFIDYCKPLVGELPTFARL